MSVNTALNSTVNFTCEATGFSTIYFRANGTATDGLENRGFHHTRRITLNGTNCTRTFLPVWAQAINNNTIISCVGEPGNINSTNAILMIQGTLIN